MESSKKNASAPDCPFLGLKNDQGTSLAYATTANHCFHCHTPAIPKLEHQDTYCLSKNFAECSVYQQPETKAFPRQLKQAVKRPAGQRNSWQLFWFVLLILVIAGLIIWQGYKSGLANQARATQNTQAIVTAFPPTVTATPFPSITPTATEIPVTPTATATATDITPQKHALETPIDVNGKQFIIHMVHDGEQMVLLARDYKTSVDAIQSINVASLTTLWSGSAVVISPGLLTSDPKLPTFKAFKVTDIEIKIEALAEKLAVDPSLLIQYNRCAAGCLLKSGDWLIVPILK